MKRICLALMILGTAARLAAAEPAAAVLDAQAQRIALIDRLKNCVLAVFPPGGQGGGSGVVISPTATP